MSRYLDCICIAGAARKCPIQVAAIDGKDLDPVNGVYHAESGITTYTLWGEIA